MIVAGQAIAVVAAITARAEGLKVIEGQVLCENTTMLSMCRELGFAIAPDPNVPDVRIAKLGLNAS